MLRLTMSLSLRFKSNDCIHPFGREFCRTGVAKGEKRPLSAVMNHHVKSTTITIYVYKKDHKKKGRGPEHEGCFGFALI